MIFSQQIVFLQKPVKSAWNFRVRRQRRVREEPVRAIDRDKKKQSWYPIVKYSLPTLIREILEKTSHRMLVNWWQWVRNLLQPHWCLPHDPFLFPCLLLFLLSCSWQPIMCVCTCVCILLCCFFSLLLVHWPPTMQQIKESSSALWSLLNSTFFFLWVVMAKRSFLSTPQKKDSMPKSRKLSSYPYNLQNCCFKSPFLLHICNCQVPTDSILLKFFIYITMTSTSLHELL